MVVDAAPFFGHPEIDLALLDYFEQVPDDAFEAYREITAIDAGFGQRRELWRIFGYLAVITIDARSAFGRWFVARLADDVSTHR